MKPKRIGRTEDGNLVIQVDTVDDMPMVVVALSVDEVPTDPDAAIALMSLLNHRPYDIHLD